MVSALLNRILPLSLTSLQITWTDTIINLSNYVASKMRIAMNQDENDYLIYNADDKAITDSIEQLDIKAQLIPFHGKELEQELIT